MRWHRRCAPFEIEWIAWAWRSHQINAGWQPDRRASTGLEDPEAARRVLGKTAQLEFRMVLDEDTTTSEMKSKLPEGVVYCADNYQKPNGSQGQDRYLIAADRNRLVEVLSGALSGDKAAAIKRWNLALVPSCVDPARDHCR